MRCRPQREPAEKVPSSVVDPPSAVAFTVTFTPSPWAAWPSTRVASSGTSTCQDQRPGLAMRSASRAWPPISARVRSGRGDAGASAPSPGTTRISATSKETSAPSTVLVSVLRRSR